MGQKTHPFGFRLGITKAWKSKWFAEKNYKEFLLEDLKIRRYIEGKFFEALIANIEIERVADRITITIHPARPGIIFGYSGKNLENLQKELKALINKEDIDIQIEAVRVPELEAKLVSFTIARQIEKRVAHRRAMKRAITQAIRLGAKGIKIKVSGRLAGAEIARSEWLQQGRVPLQTIKANIDYGTDTANTVYGTVGVKVWIYKGDVEEL